MTYRIYWRSVFLVPLVFLLLGQGCGGIKIIPPTPPPAPLPRDAALGDFSGSARWAYELAEPHFAELLPDDAVLYWILGTSVGLDGRLAANRGHWTFEFWSESLARQKSVTVGHDGEVDKSVGSSDSDPTDIRPPIPAGWLNSTEIYEAVCPGCASVQFGWAWLNYPYPDPSGQPIWMLFNVNNQLVRWDGVPIERP